MRKSLKPVLLAALVAGLSSGAAFADGDGGDNDMTPHYGDSWATMQGHEAVPVPGMEMNESSAAARDAWARARENARARLQRTREALMPGRSTSEAAPATGPASSTAPATGAPPASGDISNSPTRGY